MKRLLTLLAFGLALWVPAQAAGLYLKAQGGFTIDDAASIYNGDYIYAVTLTNQWSGGTVTPATITAAESSPGMTLGLFNGQAMDGTYTNPSGPNCCQTPFTGYTPPSPISHQGIRNFVYIVTTDPHLILTTNGVKSGFHAGRPGFEATTGLTSPGIVPESTSSMTLAGWAFLGLAFFGSTRIYRKVNSRREAVPSFG